MLRCENCNKVIHLGLSGKEELNVEDELKSRAVVLCINCHTEMTEILEEAEVQLLRR